MTAPVVFVTMKNEVIIFGKKYPKAVFVEILSISYVFVALLRFINDRSCFKMLIVQSHNWLHLITHEQL